MQPSAQARTGQWGETRHESTTSPTLRPDRFGRDSDDPCRRLRRSKHKCRSGSTGVLGDALRRRGSSVGRRIFRLPVRLQTYQSTQEIIDAAKAAGVSCLGLKNDSSPSIAVQQGRCQLNANEIVVAVYV